MDNSIVNKLLTQKKECIAVICNNNLSTLGQYRLLQRQYGYHEWIHVKNGSRDELVNIYNDYKNSLKKNITSLYNISTDDKNCSLFFGTTNLLPKIEWHQ